MSQQTVEVNLQDLTMFHVMSVIASAVVVVAVVQNAQMKNRECPETVINEM
jgi:hypothetical protein